MRKALVEGGRVEYRLHIMNRMRDRDFTFQHVERVIRSGCISDAPEYCPKFRNWRYRVRGKSDGYMFEVLVVINTEEDLDALPVIIPLTGFWTGRGTQNGKKQNRETGNDSRKAGKAVRSG